MDTLVVAWRVDTQQVQVETWADVTQEVTWGEDIPEETVGVDTQVVIWGEDTPEETMGVDTQVETWGEDIQAHSCQEWEHSQSTTLLFPTVI